MEAPRVITCTDYHTAGEPFRILTGDLPELQGDSILEKRAYALANLDEIRQLVINEPRGHADMYGCFVTAPEDEEGDLGVVFFHNAGYSTACGHGTIALVTWAIESGRISPGGETTEVIVDAPSGRLRTIARMDDAKVISVRFRNVPSFVHSTGIVVGTSLGELSVDISYGGAFYASVDCADLGVSVQPKDLVRFIALGREIKKSLESRHEIVHPEDQRLRDVYGVIFFERLPDEDGKLCQRNVTIFADGEVDRSPCGSGTSARLALLDASGELPRGSQLIHRGIVDTAFTAEVTGDAAVGERRAVITEVEGSAFLTGHHEFVLDPHDPVGTGFILR
ncbi:MAG: proline racemase family protein [Actinobacteria bacterium]|nr:proline racemase family protein [Actinomycetota bacterium]